MATKMLNAQLLTVLEKCEQGATLTDDELTTLYLESPELLRKLRAIQCAVERIKVFGPETHNAHYDRAYSDLLKLTGLDEEEQK